MNKIVSGNVYDKYGSKNPIVKYLMQGFFHDFEYLLHDLRVQTIFEIGCGEGEIGRRVKQLFPSANYIGTDISVEIIKEAKRLFSDLSFELMSIYDIPSKNIKADLIIASELFEHLLEPEKGMESLLNAKFDYLLISVPREPIWRFLNCLRGKYLGDFGNTPGHVNHWSRASFIGFIEKYKNSIEIKKVLSPFPWTIVLCLRK